MYNYDAIQSSDDYEEEIDDVHSTKEEELKKLLALREKKQKYLLQLKKEAVTDDQNHVNTIKELQKQTVKLSNELKVKEKEAISEEKRLKEIISASSNVVPPPQTQAEIDMRSIQSLRLKADAIKTDLQKAKRALSLEGGCYNRAKQIKKLTHQLAQLEKTKMYEATAKSVGSVSSIDQVELKNEVNSLKDQHNSLKLKYMGMKSRVKILENSDLKPRVIANLAKSKENDEIIQIYESKGKPEKKKDVYIEHITQQSRQQVVILGLYKEYCERKEEINLNKIENGEKGINNEIERLQRRLHLLESSISCLF